MSTPGIPNRKQIKNTSISRWIAPIYLSLLFLFVHVAMPWGLSLLSARHGWANGRPGRRNWIALILIAAGMAGTFWTISFHFRASPRSFLAFKPTEKLLTPGPYAFSRNPMYMFEMAFWFGWALFYGSTAVLIGFLAWCAMFHFVIVPWEERDLEKRFGEAYLRYKNQIPRWLGKSQRGG